MSSYTQQVPTPPTEFEEDPRYRIAQRESLLCFGYWVVFTAGAITIAWLLGHRDPAEISFIMGFPDWFFWSAIAFAGFMAAVAPYLLVRFGFTNIDLEPVPKHDASGASEVQR